MLTTSPTRSKPLLEKRRSTLKLSDTVYKDVRLQHLNPGYDNDEAVEFMNTYKEKKELIEETFRSNENINEDNFLIRMANVIIENWNQKPSPIKMLLKKIQKEGADTITMFGINTKK